MKTIKKYFPFFVISMLFIFGSCEGPINQIEDSFGNAELKKGTLQQSTLTEDEADDLIYMREEEKLAHDVYVTFYEKYTHNIFLNISESEKRHTDAILTLIVNYGLEDPALEFGKFKNPILQQLYDELIEDGSKDLKSALNVGVIIEETDIVDIGAAMERTDQKDILKVYENLLNGSLNHLKSFEKNLDKFEKKLDK